MAVTSSPSSQTAILHGGDEEHCISNDTTDKIAGSDLDANKIDNVTVSSDQSNSANNLSISKSGTGVMKNKPRKRRHSSSISLGEDAAKAKHRRQGSGGKRGAAGDIILPNKFLLGGNISDPLNLNSMLDENVNRAMNANTPSSSPLPPRNAMINIVVPDDMTDPLGLNLSPTSVIDNCNHKVVGKQLSKKKRRRRKSLHDKVQKQESDPPPSHENVAAMNDNVMHKTSKYTKRRNSRHSGLEIEGAVDEASTVHVPQVLSSEDPIVSPVIPQDVKKSSRHKRKSSSFVPTQNMTEDQSQAVSSSTSCQSSEKSASVVDQAVPRGSDVNSDNLKSRPDTGQSAMRCQLNKKHLNSASNKPNFSSKSTVNNLDKMVKAIKFKAGNSRFQFGNYSQYYGYRNEQKFKDGRMEYMKKDWFKDKDVLDVGCNAGHLTLLIARDFCPRKVVGIDIDKSLIGIARTNIRHYATAEKRPSQSSVLNYPQSMAVNYGPIVGPPLETGKSDSAKFPNNVVFVEGNYVPEKDEVLQFQEPEYDVIMCMSVSKWIHLNWGDEGLTRTFRRFYKQLRPGGKLILEPQGWKSYAKKKKLTEKIYRNFHTIRLQPEHFPRLLTKEIGFRKVEYLNPIHPNSSHGFQRSMQLYHKPE